jgi:diguanylate cyclase (GGDEF)-like protein
VSDRLSFRSATYPDAFLTAVVAVLYFAADCFLNRFALGDGWEIFWPLNGVTIALLIMRPVRQWPLLLAAVSLGTGGGEFLDGNSLPSTLIQRALSVIEVCVSASLLPPFQRLESWLSQPGLYLRFAASVVVGPAVSGAMAAVYFHSFEEQSLAAGFNSWALADALGIAAILPLVLALQSGRTGGVRAGKQVLLMAGTIGAAVAVMAAIFMVSQYPLIFVLYPLLMLVDWLLGILGSSIALCCACVMVVFLTEHGYGPFASTAALGMPRNLAVQLYLGFHLIGFLPVSILFLQQRRMDKELREVLVHTAELASLDGLTNVANRRTLDRQLEKQWQSAMQTRLPLSLLMIDVDHFKEFNDQFGHQAGDECLRALARTLGLVVTRPSDVVARFGGEEFAVLLPDTSSDGALHIAETVRSVVSDLVIVQPVQSEAPGRSNTQSQRITVSIGCVTLVPGETTPLRQLVESADRALYLAKRAGRNCVRIADQQEGWAPGSAAEKLRARVDAYRLQRQSRT